MVIEHFSDEYVYRMDQPLNNEHHQQIHKLHEGHDCIINILSQILSPRLGYVRNNKTKRDSFT